MRIPETPRSVSELDLMKRLEEYAEDKATWYPDGAALGSAAKQSCRLLHAHIVQMVDQVFAYVLDRVTSHEMDTFTMHDRMHGLKVSHLMWHILSPERRLRLSPPEIALLVYSAHLHDAGMALSRAERSARLAPESDLWDKLEVNPDTKTRLADLRGQLSRSDPASPARIRLESELSQAEQFLLALDTRERHATTERYRELIGQISDFHEKDRSRIPDVDQCLSFEGDPFEKMLIDICVSHNQDADVLIEKDRETPERLRFPEAYPIGSTTTDLHTVAAALRLADILDFDRERTPFLLFHYLVPTALSIPDNISALEWSKHLAISNWEIGQETVVFRGRSTNHIVHHAIVQFAALIESEITATRATFGVGRKDVWPFQLPDTVKSEIVSEGYHYLPYRFELDDQRVYQLLMGRAIYENPLDAVRELIQNAVDACRYRDTLSQLYEPHNKPDTQDRITVTYEESTQGRSYPLLTVTDSGTGMDAWIIERFFLKVGRSYYSSGEFLRDRADLRKKGFDFAPVSEFGIGFLSCFLLGDRVEVETAMWEPVRGDIRKRHLQIDGPTRLIRIHEDKNEGLRRFRGTQVRIHVTRTDENSTKEAFSWKAVEGYIRNVCQELPYRVNLRYVSESGTEMGFVDARPLEVPVPPTYADHVYRIPLRDHGGLIEGEVAIVPYPALRRADRELFGMARTTVMEHAHDSVLLRGGFRVGSVPGLPYTFGMDLGAYVDARVRLHWESQTNLRHMQTNLARTAPAQRAAIGRTVFETWMRYLLDHRDELIPGFIWGLSGPLPSDLDLADTNFDQLPPAAWLEQYDAYSLYELARNGWQYWVYDHKNKIDRVERWELGESAVPLVDTGLQHAILKVILPKIAPKCLLDYDGRVRLYPPVQDWREVFKSWRTFISHPVRWSKAGTYAGEIEEFLFVDSGRSPKLFNARYAEGLSQFTDEELHSLSRILHSAADAHSKSKPVVLSEKAALLLERAVETFGDLSIRSFDKTCSLSEFKAKTSPP